MSERDDRKIKALLDRISEVCPVPAAAQRVIMLSAQDDANIRDIAEAIAADPALAAEALRIANSAVFRRIRAVETLGQAVVTLGLSQINQMASAMALMAAFRTEHELALQFHQTSVLSGSIAGLLSGVMAGVDRGAAFLAGLLCEVGAMACVAVDGERFGKIFDQSAGSWERRQQLEEARYGLASWEIGRRLLLRNNLPDTICAAVGAQFGGEDDGDQSELGRVTVFGRMVAPEIVALPEEDEVEVLKERLAEVSALCGLSRFAGEQQLVDLCTRAVAAAVATLSY